MRNRNLFRYLLVLVLALAVTLSCNLVMNPINQTVGVVSTAKSVATQIEGIATQVDIQGIATGIQEFSTQVDMGSIATSIQDLSTQVDMGSISTQIEGIATNGGQGLISTIMSNATEIPGVGGAKPTDIPVMPGDATELTASATNVTYISSKPAKEVVVFYEQQMPAKGWTKKVAGSTIGTDNATLIYTKGGRTATVTIETIPFVNQTTVTIDITGS